MTALDLGQRRIVRGFRKYRLRNTRAVGGPPSLQTNRPAFPTPEEERAKEVRFLFGRLQAEQHNHKHKQKMITLPKLNLKQENKL